VALPAVRIAANFPLLDALISVLRSPGLDMLAESLLSLAGSPPEFATMPVLDRLYSLEVEFHRQFRAAAADPVEAWSIRTSYALQHGYEPLLRSMGVVDVAMLNSVKERLSRIHDPRDVLAAFQSLRQLIDVA
jgi:hypothetical protein